MTLLGLLPGSRGRGLPGRRVFGTALGFANLTTNVRLRTIKVIIVPVVEVRNFHRGRLVMHVLRVLRCFLHVEDLVGTHEPRFRRLVEVVVLEHGSMARYSLRLLVRLRPQLLAQLGGFYSAAVGTETPCALAALLLEGCVEFFADNLLVVVFGGPIIEAHAQFLKGFVGLRLLILGLVDPADLGREALPFSRFPMLRFRFIV